MSLFGGHEKRYQFLIFSLLEIWFLILVLILLKGSIIFFVDIGANLEGNIPKLNDGVNSHMGSNNFHKFTLRDLSSEEIFMFA